MKPGHSPLTRTLMLLLCLTAGAAAAECTYHINRNGPCSPGDPQKARSDNQRCAASRRSVLFE